MIVRAHLRRAVFVGAFLLAGGAVAGAWGARVGGTSDRPPAPAVQGASALPRDLASSIEEIEKRLEGLRGLAFKEKVATSLLSQEGVREYLRGKLRNDYPGEKLAAEESALRYFGFLPGDQNLERLLLDLLRDQVAGMYDPERKILFVVPGPAFGSVALSHELVHALADQHFDLPALLNGVREDDDRALALSGLFEGEASMVTVLWAIESSLDPAVVQPSAGDGSDLYRAAQAGLSSAPPFLRETLLFPYLSGMAWAAEVMRKGGGVKALDPWFRNPPDSTEQILHPEKSLDPRDLPSRIDDDLLLSSLPEGSRTVKLNTMGEFGIRLLLGGPDRDRAARAAEGWDGDRYLLGGSGGTMSLIWLSAWDTEADAAEFREEASAWLERRGGRAASAGAVMSGRVVVVAEGGGPPASGAAARRAGSIASRLPAGIEIR